jgi:hypothetical protein
MRYCVSGRQPYSVMKRADEIKVTYADRDRIFDFIEKIPDKTIILDVPEDEKPEWNNWYMYQDKFYEFYIALHKLERATEFNDNGIKWYWPYPITSYYELHIILALGPSYLMIGPPLSFDLDNVANFAYEKDSATPIPLRMVCNNARPSYLPLPDPIENTAICGQWVRPEDAKLYSTRVQCFEFENVDLKQEEALLHIYKENQNWPGNLNLILQNLHFNVDNRAIPEELGERRMTCGQRCWSTSSCRLCQNALRFAEELRKERDRRVAKAALDNK